MYISGGLIPYYVLIYNLNLVNNFLVYIIPVAFSTFEVLLVRTFIEALPESYEESALIDGANKFTIFMKIIIPLCAPVIATITLFHGVYQWNDWFTSLLFITKEKLQPIQMLLQRILFEADVDLKSLSKLRRMNKVSTETVRMTTLIVTTVPILFIYPFLQKHFIKGMTLGGIKG